MIENIFFDEIKSLSGCVEKYIQYFGEKENKSFETLYIISDTNYLGGYLVPAMTGLFGEGHTVVVEAFENSSVNKDFCEANYPGAVYVPFESFRNMQRCKCYRSFG